MTSGGFVIAVRNKLTVNIIMALPTMDFQDQVGSKCLPFTAWKQEERTEKFIYYDFKRFRDIST